MWTFVILCAFLVALASGTSSSRMFYAFARDGAIPASSFFHHLHPELRIPRNAVWGCFVLASILGLPTLASNIAFNAVVSIAVIGLSISYACPIFGRLFLSPTYDASLGGFRLGRLSAPLAGAALCWLGFMCIIFCLPPVFPINVTNLNFAPIAVGIVLVWCLGTWFVPGPWPLGAQTWFAGPPVVSVPGEPAPTPTEAQLVYRTSNRALFVEEGGEGEVGGAGTGSPEGGAGGVQQEVHV